MSATGETSLIATIIPEVCFPPNVESNGGIVKSPSSVSEFIADEEAASICPLLTPSPPAEFEHPLSVIPTPAGMAYERQISPTSLDEMATLPNLNGSTTLGFVGLATTDTPPNEPSDGHIIHEGAQDFKPASSVQSVMDSSSSSSSVLQEPTACAQLLSSHHHYQHLTKASDVDSFVCQENGGKPPLTGIQLAVRKSTADFCFLDWNWPLIRKCSFWGSISLLVACMCVVITLITRLPNKCNPEHEWWQGTTFYEVFPASFKDDNDDGLGDLRGLGKKALYVKSLGVRAIRLNSIFVSPHYPETFDEAENLTEIEPQLGNLNDFDFVISSFHKYNVSVILDIPIFPFLKQLSKNDENENILGSGIPDDEDNWIPIMDLTRDNETDEEMLTETNVLRRIKRTEKKDDNVITEALRFWLKRGVDGFYLKGLEELIREPNFGELVREWRRVTRQFSGDWGRQKILICNIEVLNLMDPREDSRKVSAVVNNFDLVDVKLDVGLNGSKALKLQVDRLIQGSFLYNKPGYPWIHWHMGSVTTPRVASQLAMPNATLAAILFQMMLPGTPSIFYGDEIGLQDLNDPEGERADIKHVHHLPPMHWSTQTSGVGFSSPDVLSWLPSSLALSDANSGHQAIIQKVASLRDESPAIYMNGVWRDHELIPNYNIRTVDADILILERSFPRRHSYVVVSNFGSHTQTKDLSFIYYGGKVMVDLRGRVGQYLTFHTLTLYAGESLIIKLDK